MNIIKVCMECGKEIENNIKFDNTLSCLRCGSGDIYQLIELYYDEITLEECFAIYNEDKLACICNADKRQVIFVEE